MGLKVVSQHGWVEIRLLPPIKVSLAVGLESGRPFRIGQVGYIGDISLYSRTGEDWKALSTLLRADLLPSCVGPTGVALSQIEDWAKDFLAASCQSAPSLDKPLDMAHLANLEQMRTTLLMRLEAVDRDIAHLRASAR